MMSDTRRKLTTVFTADVQSYSRLMEVDEEGTLATLKLYRSAMSRLIESHDGRVINTWGDGLFAEFPSVVEAVRAAVDIQNDLAQRNAGRPRETRMQFRIGINLGDVIADGDDIYGDGVNIAARLQATAPPGGIVISNTVYDQVRNKLPVGFEFLGDLAVKNIDHEVPSYAVLIGEGARARRHGRRRKETDPLAGFGSRAARVAVDAVETVGRRGGLNLSPKLAKLGVVAVFLVLINIFTGLDNFWAVWPILAFAVLVGLDWARGLPQPSRRRASLLVVAAGIVGVNLLSWSGDLWAVWPLLGLALVAALDWARNLGPGRS